MSTTVHGRTIDIRNRGKVFFPDSGLTKGDLVDYYERIAPTMLPHLADRPVAVRRFPDGIASSGFFQKQARSHFPDWLRREDVPKREGGTLDHPIVDEPATIVYLADQGAIEFHMWLSTAADLEAADQLVVDLDPPKDEGPRAVRAAARIVRDVFEELGVTSLVKTSGSSGYHVHVPFRDPVPFDRTRRFGARLAALLSRRHPDRLTDSQRRSGREGRVFVDVLRNAYGQTAVAPYSVRARPGAPIAAPIDWDELRRIAPRDVTVQSAFRRLGQTSDPWADAWDGARADFDAMDDALAQLED